METRRFYPPQYKHCGLSLRPSFVKLHDAAVPPPKAPGVNFSLNGALDLRHPSDDVIIDAEIRRIK